MTKTLDKLARKLKVSRRTLSRVFKNDKNVSKVTRKKIEEFLEKEKYSPAKEQIGGRPYFDRCGQERF